MVFRTTPQLGPEIGKVYTEIPYWDNNGAITEPSYRLGNVERGSDGGEYMWVKASAAVTATSNTGTQVDVTVPAMTIAAGSGGWYTPPGVAVPKDAYVHVRRGEWNAKPA